MIKQMIKKYVQNAQWTYIRTMIEKHALKKQNRQDRMTDYEPTYKHTLWRRMMIFHRYVDKSLYQYPTFRKKTQP